MRNTKKGMCNRNHFEGCNTIMIHCNIITEIQFKHNWQIWETQIGTTILKAATNFGFTAMSSKKIQIQIQRTNTRNTKKTCAIATILKAVTHFDSLQCHHRNTNSNTIDKYNIKEWPFRIHVQLHLQPFWRLQHTCAKHFFFFFNLAPLTFTNVDT